MKLEQKLKKKGVVISVKRSMKFKTGHGFFAKGKSVANVVRTVSEDTLLPAHG